MAKKALYDITMKKDNSKVQVEGETYYDKWGIHKREDKMFTLTHLDSGMLVCSSERKKDLVELLQDPEFKEGCWSKGVMPKSSDVNRLSKVIGKFYTKKNEKKC